MIRVTCAIIKNEEEKILVVQRGEKTDHPFKWEFPGGKVDQNEADDDCVIREIKEELSIDIVITGKLYPVEYDYGHKQIVLIPFICDTLDDIPFLAEHVAYKWVEPEMLKTVDFSEADIIVAENFLDLNRSDSEEKRTIVPEAEIIGDSEIQSMIDNIMSMKEAEWMATSAIENPALFRKLLQFSYSGDRKLAFRSSWILTKVCDRFPDLIMPFIPQMIDSLAKIENESTLRSFLRILSLTDAEKISRKQHGILADFCFSSLSSGLCAIAIKAYSMEILYRLTLLYPELATELKASLTNLLEEGSAGVTSRGRAILRRLGELPMA